MVTKQLETIKTTSKKPYKNATCIYSTTQPQVNKRVRATRKHSQVTLRALASHSRALNASHASAKGVNCTACGSEIASASTKRVRVKLQVQLTLRVRVKLRVRV